MAAQLRHSHLEGDPRARGRLLEHEGHAAPLERPRGAAIGLELGGAVEQGAELGARKLLAREEVAGHPAIL